MKSLFDKLNLRPQERRMVVIVAIVVFAVANFVFVFPIFGDLGKTQQKKRDAERTLEKFKTELGRESQYKRELDRLEKMGGYLPSEEQALELQREVYQQAQQSGVIIVRSDASRSGGISAQRTNSFFEEQTLVIHINSGEKELVDFLYGLGKGQSLTRVASMNLQRDPSQTKLAGPITLVKSFQKKPPRAAAPTTMASTAKAATPSPSAKASPPPASKASPTNIPPRPLSSPAARK